MSDRTKNVLEAAGGVLLVVAAAVAFGPGAAIGLAGVFLIVEANFDR